MLLRVEGNNADRVIELTRHQIGDDRFQVRPLDFGLAANAAQTVKAVYYEIGGLVRAGKRNQLELRPTASMPAVNVP